MMIVPRKDPEPLKRSRRSEDPIGYYDHKIRPGRLRNCEPYNYIAKADQNSRKVYSALWLILIFGIWIAGIAYVISLFV